MTVIPVLRRLMMIACMGVVGAVLDRTVVFIPTDQASGTYLLFWGKLRRSGQ